MSEADDLKQAHDFLCSKHGNYLIAQAFHYFRENAPDSANRDDMAFIVDTIWPDHVEMFRENPSLVKEFKKGKSAKK